MTKLIAAFSFTFSLAAAGIAGFLLFESAEKTPGPIESDAFTVSVDDVAEIKALLRGLETRVRALEAQEHQNKRAEIPVTPETAEDNTTLPGSEPELWQKRTLSEQVQALHRRLGILENSETIAKLAEDGKRQVAQTEIQNAVSCILDRESRPEDRLAAMKRLGRAVKDRKQHSLIESVMNDNELTEQDLVMPMVELAQDRTQEPALRADIIRNMAGIRIEEVRQPLIDMLLYDDATEVRNEAMHTLLYHLDNVQVRETITEISRTDPDEAVRARAEKFMPKVNWVENRINRQNSKNAHSDKQEK